MACVDVPMHSGALQRPEDAFHVPNIGTVTKTTSPCKSMPLSKYWHAKAMEELALLLYG